ncbi:MAG TPA: tripartite tricarboxylate transporter substrate binding protein [Bradyrhizobium sp.]|nr:tripartite tricarboxylate transporter substrate binding protein [Bradyrhizobium sp.]
MTRRYTEGNVTLTRRAMLQSAAWTAVASLDLATSTPARATAVYPSRPVTWVLPFAAGGATGRLARPVCDRLALRLGQPFVFENRPGAGGNVGTQSVIDAAPDGYTILATSTANAISVTFDPSLPFDAARDLVHVAGLARMPLLLLVSNDLPVKTLAEFLAYAKANPGKLSVGSAGLGTVQHLSAELFRVMTGIQWTHVHYRGSGPGLVDLSSGHVHAMFENIASSLELLQSGKVRPLAVTTQQRWERMPDLPPVHDVLPGFETSGFYGTAMPRGTPPDIVALLNREINDALRDGAIRQQYSEIGAIPMNGDVLDYAAQFAAEIIRWRRLVALTGVRKDS